MSGIDKIKSTGNSTGERVKGKPGIRDRLASAAAKALDLIAAKGPNLLDEAGVKREYPVREPQEPLTEEQIKARVAEIRAGADRVHPSDWVQGTTARHLKMTQDVIDRGDAARAAGIEVTEDILRGDQ